MGLSYRLRLLIVLLSIVVLAGGALLFKNILIPDSFGIYGYYRADAISEAALVPIRHWTNISCFKCHPYEAKIHKNGHHQTISCEFCHGTYADHVENEKKKLERFPLKKKKKLPPCALNAITRKLRPGKKK